MSEYFIKPSLASLPTELFHMIFPYAINLDVPLETTFDLKRYPLLRALSQTCRSLRQYALPFIYARIEVKTMKHLGELHELLVSSPSIAPLVKSFRFLWDMDGDGTHDKLEVYAPAEGSALELAFRDRLQMWGAINMQIKSLKTGEEDWFNDESMLFTETRCFAQPGRLANSKDIKRLGDVAKWRRVGGRGPDGNGEDKLIKNATQFAQCITELVCMLTSIETFGWETQVTPMPRDIFDALIQLPALTDLRVILSTCRGNFSELPLWQLAGNLRLLDIQTYDFAAYDSSFRGIYGDEDDEETTIEMIEKHPSALSAHMELVGDNEELARGLLHFRTAQRAIVVAAQGGHLKYLNPGESWDRHHDYYAKIPALLPHWLAIEHWGSLERTEGHWDAAAVKLRRTFAHVSLHRDWLALDASVSQSSIIAKATPSRLLSQEDLVKLESYCEMRHDEESDDFGEDFCEISHEVYWCYLPWLVKDAKLGQQVLDAWSAIVERGEADKVKCNCKKCKAWYKS